MAIDTVTSEATREGLPIFAQQAVFESYVPQAPGYWAVLLFGLIQMLRWEAIGSLIIRVKQWTMKEGLVFVTVFSREDPSYDFYSREGRPLGRNSFITAAGDIRTFLEPDEILDLFRDFSALHHWEGMGPVHRHGHGPEERHARIEAVFQKTIPAG